MVDREPADLVIVSDLHLGEGRDTETGRYAPLEDFFHDTAFARFLDALKDRYRNDPSRLALVLNGDILDFLTVTSVPEPGVGFIEPTAAERRFGLEPTVSRSLFKLDAIVAGHEEFFAALARFVAAGHRVEIVRGNHDLEFYFEAVQERLREHLCRIPGGPSADLANRLVRFHQWFYLEPGRVLVEHGNQYEASNSIRYPLRPLQPPRGRGVEEEPRLDYPLGSYFVRYFYNRVRRIDPYTPRIVSFEQYLDLLKRYNLLDLFWVFRDHYPFFIGALAPGAPTGRSRSTSQDDASQERDFDDREAETEPPGLYRALNALKIHPMSASKMALVRELLEPIVRRVLWFAGLGILSLYAWMLVFSLIQSTPWLASGPFGKASLLAILSVVTVVGLFWVGNHIGRKLRRRGDVAVDVCAQRAEEIARVARVRVVVMGHTHIPDVRRFDGGATYANGGSWISVDNPWDRLVPDARRFPFVHVRGDSARVCRWNDTAGRVDEVPFFDMPEDPSRERLPDGAVPRPVTTRDRPWRLVALLGTRRRGKGS